MVGSKFPSSYGIQDELKGDFDLEENQRASQGIAEAVEFTPRVRSNPWRIEFYEKKKQKLSGEINAKGLLILVCVLASKLDTFTCVGPSKA